MKLATELTSAEKSSADKNFTASTLKFANFLREQARAGEGAVLCSCETKQVELMLLQWAEDEGFTVSPGVDTTGSRAVWVVWGFFPSTNPGATARFSRDGSLVFQTKTTHTGVAK